MPMYFTSKPIGFLNQLLFYLILYFKRSDRTLHQLTVLVENSFDRMELKQFFSYVQFKFSLSSVLFQNGWGR